MLTPSQASATSSRKDLRVSAFSRQIILRQLAMVLLFGLSLLNTLLWKGVPLSWLLVDMGLTLLAGVWVLSRYFGFGKNSFAPIGKGGWAVPSTTTESQMQNTRRSCKTQDPHIESV
jgi:hypothetical protein